MGEIELPFLITRAEAKRPPTRSAGELPLGTRIERTWRGRPVVATRVDGGWSCEGATYKSLSGAAKAVSGSHVSGPAFFNLRARKGGSE